MSTLVLLLAAWASFAGLATWSTAAPTRALGEAQGPRGHAATQVAFLVGAQLLCAIVAAGPCAGLAVVACAWMVAGWCYTLALNTWPARSLAWAWRSGWAALDLALVGTVALAAMPR